MSTRVQPPVRTWRAQVRVWLRDVNQQRKLFSGSLQTAARQNQSRFPRNLLVRVVAIFIRRLAVRIIKSALKDAAGQLNISISNEELDAIADLAVDALLAG